MAPLSNGMVSAAVGSFGAFAGLLYVIRYLWGRKQRVSVQDKVVLITGASSGLGEACAHIFYQAGAKVILAARRIRELERVSKEIQATNVNGTVHKPVILHLDLEDLGDIPRAAHEALGIYGHVDILISNGGISFRGAVTETVLEVDVKVMTVNYFGQVALTKALLPSMVARQKGHIVTISSIQGKMAIPFRSPYAASKHAAQAFFDSLRAEVAHKSIKVTVVSPAYIRTNLSLNAVTGDGTTYGKLDSTTKTGMSPEYVAKRVLEAVITGQKDVVLAPLITYIISLLRSVWPNLYFYMMAFWASKQRSEIEEKKKR